MGFASHRGASMIGCHSVGAAGGSDRRVRQVSKLADSRTALFRLFVTVTLRAVSAGVNRSIKPSA
jgi:hypothetical protein